MLTNIFTVLALVATAIAAPTLETRGDKPDPSQVTIKGITTSGTGCPQGSVGKFISSDLTTFTLIFDKYVASIGPGVATTESRKFCQINLQLHYPQGFQYSIMSTIYRGYAALDAGVSGTQEATYYFSGQSNQVSTKSVFKGPLTKDYTIQDNIPVTSTIWSQCGADLPINIKSQISLSTSSKTASDVTAALNREMVITQWVKFCNPQIVDHEMPRKMHISFDV
ncbi:hypothetical protein M7I_6622 [Glarea lozoyensis 74030]|uniref:Secreted protein n=1 Tax=Glarea lozoyensis (strain ATCC 74030 / MF5533) TaxID=1104152 RepID=H0EV29_GLAL7|nr:hypothetical protein M7I_6622 [Glarea lozoyensis 74030]